MMAPARATALLSWSGSSPSLPRKASAAVPYQWVIRRLFLGRFLDSDAIIVPPGGSRKLGGDDVSSRMIHAGFIVRDREAEDHFYKDILGFHLYWHGGMKDDQTDWVAMQVRDGTDWLEYMLRVHNPSPKALGVMHHFAIGVPAIQPAYKTVVARGLNPPQPPKIGRDGKWQLNLYDPNYTRAELMEFEPAEKPCCSPMQ